MTYPITLNVNGVPYPLAVAANASLLRVVREQVGLTGSKEGCDDSECGACMMLLDGEPVNSCSYLAVQADGSEVTTVEGLMPGDDLAPLQESFLVEGGVQCGFCTPGMLISATKLLRDNPQPSSDEVRLALSGNLCRCTGYDGIVRAVLDVASASVGDAARVTDRRRSERRSGIDRRQAERRQVDIPVTEERRAGSERRNTERRDGKDRRSS